MTHLHRLLNLPLDQPIPADKLREAQRDAAPSKRALATLATNLQKRAKNAKAE